MTYYLNGKTLTFGSIIYVSKTGNDTSGDGSKTNPYLTFDKGYTIASATANGAVVLGDGTFAATNYASSYISSKNISILGNGLNTTLTFPGTPDSHLYPVGSLYFYKLIIKSSSSGFALFIGDGNSTVSAYVYFYNVVYYDTLTSQNINFGDWTSSGSPSRGSVTAVNSSFYTSSNLYGAKLYFTNCSFNVSSFNTNGNCTPVFTTSFYSTTYDSSTWKITNKTWEHTGTGTEADGQTCSIGVYGGDYSWDSSSALLLKSNNQYYSILPDFYDTTNLIYNPLTTVDFNKGFTIDVLTKSVTINNETFKPIDKFNSFQIISKSTALNLSILGLKKTKQLIVANDDIPVSLASNIDSFTLSYNIASNGKIKLILSIDKGLTWLTWNTSTSVFENISLTIPLKTPSSQTDEEKTNWNNAIDIILTSGIDASIFSTLNFNLLNAENIRFAYVLERPSCSDTAETSQLQWQFDAQGCFQKMKESEYDVFLYDKEIQVVSNIASDIIKINTLY